jgi:hypothetical protein
MREATQVAARLGAAGVTANLTGSPGQLIGRRAARELARRELSRSIYQPGIAQRLLAWLDRLLSSASSAVPGGWWSAVALAISGVLVVSAVIFWVRPARGRGSVRPAVLTDRPRSAADYRRNAEELAAAGDYSAAIVDRVRAIAAELEEREIVPARPGRTADELASEAGQELPAHAADLSAAMRLFDDVRYGDRPGTEAGYLRVSHLDAELRSARPAGAQTSRQALTGAGGSR